MLRGDGQLCRIEVRVEAVVGYHQVDRRSRSHRVSHLNVEGGLEGPTLLTADVVDGRAGDDRGAMVGRRAGPGRSAENLHSRGRKPERRIVGVQVALECGTAEGVDYHNLRAGSV